MKLIDLLETPASLAHETNIAQEFEKRGATIWAEPRGDDANWPDVGATFNLPSGTVHVHAEVKMSKNDVMGSLRKWTFDGQNFSATPPLNDNEVLLLEVMNSSEELKKRAAFLLDLLKQHFHPDIKGIYSGVLSIVKDKTERYDQVVKFLENGKKAFGGKGNNFQLSTPRINDPRLGAAIIQHYRSKFTPLPNGANMMMFIIGKEMFAIPPINIEPQLYGELLEVLGVKNLPELPDAFDGNLEVRTQVRGMSKKGAKPVKLDVMSSLRAPGLKDLKGASLG